jgi:hypothetical protein
MAADGFHVAWDGAAAAEARGKAVEWVTDYMRDVALRRAGESEQDDDEEVHAAAWAAFVATISKYKLQRRGQVAQAAVEASAAEVVMKDLDILGAFIRERCVLAPKEAVATRELLDALNAYDGKGLTWGCKKLAEAMRVKGFVKKLVRLRGGAGPCQCYVGLRLAQ